MKSAPRTALPRNDGRLLKSVGRPYRAGRTDLLAFGEACSWRDAELRREVRGDRIQALRGNKETGERQPDALRIDLNFF